MAARVAAGSAAGVAAARKGGRNSGAVRRVASRSGTAVGVKVGSVGTQVGLAAAAACSPAPRAVRRSERSVATAAAADALDTVEVAASPAGDKQEGVAKTYMLRMSPFKVRKVLNTIRGRDYEDCLMILEFMPYRACQPVLKTLVSAASNAKNNLGMNKSKLYVSECYADGGKVLKRYQPRAQGRAGAIQKFTTNVTIKVAERD